jgi:branched-subunit amino acid aminotransferase/4-amino-4-deoxychorismate lyase
MSKSPLVWLDGVFARNIATVPVMDQAFVRGNGVFEVVRVARGRFVGLEQHMMRLQRSASLVGLQVDLERARAAVEAAARGDDAGVPAMSEGMVRLMVARDAENRYISVRSPLPTYPEALHLVAMVAGWHPGSAVLAMEAGGLKTLSYANNMLSTRLAEAAGGDDAVLVSSRGHILDGPTFCVAWTQRDRPNTWFTPNSAELALLPSVTLWAAANAVQRFNPRISIVDSTATIQDWLRDPPAEIVALSSSKDVFPVRRVSVPIDPSPRPAQRFGDGPHSLDRFLHSSEPVEARIGRALALVLGDGLGAAAGARRINLEVPGAKGTSFRELRRCYDAFVDQHGERF